MQTILVLKNTFATLCLALLIIPQVCLGSGEDEQKQQVRSIVTAELSKAFSSTFYEVGVYELSHALASMARYQDADKRLNLTAEQWNQIKMGSLKLSPELRLRMIELVGESYHSQLDQYVEFLSAHDPPDPIAIKIGVETARGAAALGFAFLATLLSSTGALPDSESLRDGFYTLSVLASIYAFTRPFKALSLAIHHNEAEERNKKLVKARTKNMHIPEKLLQTSFVFLYLTLYTNSLGRCDQAVSAL